VCIFYNFLAEQLKKPTEALELAKENAICNIWICKVFGVA
jgi:hypothetical protein